MTELEKQNTQEIVPFRCDIIEDEKGLGRYVYELNDGTRIFIKDPGEIPSIKIDGNSFVLTPEELPPGINHEDYDSWIRTNTSTELEESKNIIVNNTVLGSLDLAMTLIKKGELNPEAARSIAELRTKIAEDKIDNQVLDLYDNYLAAGFAPEQNKYPINYSHDGLILLAMSLCGDEKAISEIRRREINLEEHAIQYESGLEPGTKLTKEQLEKIANEHLVAVHTTYTDVNGEDFALQSTSAHRKDTIRSTIHCSLNHSVISHLGGNFEGRDTTVVSRLESLVRDNGSPAVMYGVDTYFTMNPKEELVVSKDIDESLIISFVDSMNDARPFTYNGNILTINKEKLEGDGLKNILDELNLENFDAIESLGYLIYKRTLYNSKNEIEESDTPLQFLVKQKYQNEGIESWKASSEIVASILDGTIKLDNYPSKIYEDTKYQISYRIESLKEEIQEFVRKLIVDRTIIKYGGQIVSSDGISAYIETEGFDSRITQLAREIGIRIGLHSNQSESRLEKSLEYVHAVVSNRKARRHLAKIGVAVEKMPPKREDNFFF